MSTVARLFSAASRRADWASIEERTFDVVVIGGGITGCGIALDAVTRGLSVALVERGDIGSGTSSRSSRLVHGGLRYLETLDFGLVFEASAERRRLLRLAPHLVRPLPFLFPIWRGDRVGPARLRAGLLLYDALALGRNVSPHRMLRRRKALRVEPELRSEGLLAAGWYHDAAVDDGRLTLSVARGAHRAGAVVLPRVRVFGFRGSDGGLRRVHVRDELGGDRKELRARVVVNATGPWCDEVRRIADPTIVPRLRPTKGVHVMVARERLGNRGALIFPSGIDGRVMFILPWRGRTYIGTTDTEFRDRPESAAADRADVSYLLESANEVFPAARLSPGDVISTWAGVRPLLGPPSGGASASAISREHAIWTDPSGLLNAAGGKLTTYRAMAEEVVDEIAETLREGWEIPAAPCITHRTPLPDCPEDMTALLDRVERELRAIGIGESSAIHLVGSYGASALELLAAARARPELREPVVEDLPYLWAEISHSARTEMVLDLSDVLRRRTHLFYEAEDGALSVANRVAEFLSREGGLSWDRDEIERQLAAYQEEVELSRDALRTAGP